jgi:seryl-tRNA synthetase
MLDIKIIREKPEDIKNNLMKRGDPKNIKIFEKLVDYDKKWRRSLKILNELRHKRKKININILKLKKDGKNISAEILIAKKLDSKITILSKKIKKLEKNRHDKLFQLPNLLDKTVPLGKDKKDNIEIRKWGKKPKLGFKLKNHVEILNNLGLVDFERAGKISGTGFVYLKEDIVLLDLAIQKFAIDFLRKKGFILVEPPFMMKKKPYEGVTDLGDFENVMYKSENEDLYLIATSEHPLAAMFMDEVITKNKLPIKFVGISPCFRKEVGTHGKFTKGFFRMHQFNKVEQFILCLPEESERIHERIQDYSEELYQQLGLYYRVVNVCTGDIGTIAAKKYDTEVWMADNEFREIGSNSNCKDYQARRLNIRWREGEGKPVAGFVHTLNSTALATSRVMIAIIEQFQQKDATIIIPKVLRNYLNKEKIQPKTKLL